MSEPILSTPTTISPPAEGGSGWFNDSARQALDTAFKGKTAARTGETDPETETPAPEPVTPPAPAPAPRQAAAAAPAKTPEVKVPPLLPPTQAKPAAPEKYVPGKMKSSDWETLRSERDAARAEAEQLRQATANFNPQAADDYKKAAAERDQAMQILQRVAIERDPEFNRSFQAAIDGVKADILSVVGADKAPVVERLLKAGSGKDKDKAIASLVEDMPVYQQMIFGSALAKHDSLHRERDTKIAASQANWEALQAERQSQQRLVQERKNAEMDQAFDATLKDWQTPDKGLVFLQHKEGDTAHNESVNSTLALARRIYSGALDPTELSQAALYSALAPRLLETLYATQQELAALKKQSAELQELQPGSSGAPGYQSDSGGDAPNPNLSYGQSIAAAVRQAGVTGLR